MTNPKTTRSRQIFDADIKKRARGLLSRMTLAEKIGQMNQLDATGRSLPAKTADAIRAGQVGSILNVTTPDVSRAAQIIATEESRLGIPLLIARDVIHGFRTIMPIPLAQAASFSEDLIEAGAHHSAIEAKANGINWTFSPMVDVSRDPRWGRIAESFGEDPLLNGRFGAAMVRGYQKPDADGHMGLAACAKHYVGYGAAEGGRDYNTTNIATNELHNVYLPPFHRLVEAGVAAVMTSFGDLDGVPASANRAILDKILRRDWGYDGMVVSDWDSIGQLLIHGFVESRKEAAYEALSAGVDMDMFSGCYLDHLAELVASGRLTESLIDDRVAAILALKFALGLFDQPERLWPVAPPADNKQAARVARELAARSVVLLGNDHDLLPLDRVALKKIALIGPMADQPAEQMGTWVFDGDANRSTTPLEALRQALPKTEIVFDAALRSTRDRSEDSFPRVRRAVAGADVAIVCIGEEAILSGEAHSRADITLPGAQSALLRAVKETGVPVVAVIMAGRPLVLSDDVPFCDALLYAWHGGSETGPALVDLLLGVLDPSGKLPVTLPRHGGQIPLYYAHKNTGRPADEAGMVHIDDIPVGAPQTSLGMTSFYLDAGFRPLYPFGFGLSYTRFDYTDLVVETPRVRRGDPVRVRVRVTNIGTRTGTEVVQLYLRDRVGSLTRPVRELKAFERITLTPADSMEMVFTLTEADLSFHRRDGSYGCEPGWFDVWIGGNSLADVGGAFVLEPG